MTWLRLPADQSQNGKAATLALGEPYWSGDIFVISDADMVCGPDYLSHVLGEFQDPEVGVVTSLYRGVAKDGWKIGSLFESLCILDFASSVLVAEKVEGVTFAMGSTMAIRREVLQQIGGFEALKSYLADDFQLGFRAAQKGWRVALAPLVLDTHLTHSNLRQALEHQYRWLVTSRVSRPLGHAAFLLTQGMLWSALLSWFVAQVWPLALWCALRIFLGTQQSRLLQGVSSKPFWPHLFLPFKDILFLGLWVSSHFGHRVKWGEKMIEIDGQGRIVG